MTQLNVNPFLFVGLLTGTLSAVSCSSGSGGTPADTVSDADMGGDTDSNTDADAHRMVPEAPKIFH